MLDTPDSIICKAMEEERRRRKREWNSLVNEVGLENAVKVTYETHQEKMKLVQTQRAKERAQFDARREMFRKKLKHVSAEKRRSYAKREYSAKCCVEYPLDRFIFLISATSR